MECRARLLLKLAVKIDQKVAAGDEIHSRERRILEHAVAGEEDDVTKIMLDLIMAPLAREEAAEPLFCHIGFDRERIAALARDRKRPDVEIRPEDLNRRVRSMAYGFFKQQNPDRVRLLAGGTAWNPHADRISAFPVAEQFRQH